MTYPTATGTSFLDAFQSCLLMKPGARRRMNASCLALPWPNFERTRNEGRKGLLHQLLRRHQSDTVALGNICRQVSLHRGRQELDDFYAGFLPIGPVMTACRSGSPPWWRCRLVRMA